MDKESIWRMNIVTFIQYSISRIKNVLFFLMSVDNVVSDNRTAAQALYNDTVLPKNV